MAERVHRGQRAAQMKKFLSSLDPKKIEMYTDYLFPLLPLKRKAGPEAKASPPKAKAATKTKAGSTSTSVQHPPQPPLTPKERAKTNRRCRYKRGRSQPVTLISKHRVESPYNPARHLHLRKGRVGHPKGNKIRKEFTDSWERKIKADGLSMCKVPLGPIIQSLHRVIKSTVIVGVLMGSIGAGSPGIRMGRVVMVSAELDSPVIERAVVGSPPVEKRAMENTTSLGKLNHWG